MESIVRIHETAYLLEVTQDPELENAGTIGNDVPVLVVQEGTRLCPTIWEPASGYEDEAEAAAEGAFTTFV